MVRLRRELSRTIDPLDEDGLDQAGEVAGFEFVGQGFALPPQHSSDGVGQLAAAFSFDQLAIQKLFIDLPVIGSGSGRAKPTTEVGGDGVEVRPQAIREKQGYPAWFQGEFEVVEQGIGILLSASSQIERGDQLAERIDGQPQPSGFAHRADPGVQLIELEYNRYQQAQIAMMPSWGGGGSLQPAGVPAL